MDIKTTGNKILIKIEKESKEEKTESGIIFERNSVPKDVIKAEVIGIGKDVREVQVGDEVICEKQTTKEFIFDFETFCIVPEPSILGYKSSSTKMEKIND